MIKYKDQLINRKFNTHEVFKRNKVRLYSDDILTFDIEVTSAWMKEGKLIGYEPGHDAEYWNSMEAYALPYIWQFSFNDEVYYGRDIRTFERVLEDLPRDINFCIFVHNLPFEFAHLVNFLEPDDVFATSPHKVIKCTFKGYENIEFRCSYILTNLSLESWGKQLEIPKLVGELEYTYLRTPMSYDPETTRIIGTPMFDYELDYCERDCEVVKIGIRDHLKTYGHIEDIPLTSTGKVRRVYKNMVVDDPEYMKDVKRTIPKDARFYKLLKTRLFQGGYVHANRRYLAKICKKGHHDDIRSSYPAVMCAYKFPYGKFVYIGRIIPDPKFFEDRAYIIKLHFTNIRSISWNTYISGSKCRSREAIFDNGRIIKASEVWLTCTETDLITICNNYTWDMIESEGTYYCRKKYLPKVFIDFVLQLYHDKTALKGVDPEKYMQSKRFVNSMFGMCVTSLFQSSVDFDFTTGEWSIDELTEEYVDSQLDKLKMFWNKKYFLSYQVGVWITSYARRRLWQMIEYCDEDLLYTDTDSIFYYGDYDFTWFDDDITNRLKKMCEEVGCDFELTKPMDPKGGVQPLGTLDHEPDFDEFKTLGAKKYCEKRGDDLFLTVSGVNKSAVSCLNGDIDNFCDGFIFDKDHPDVHKLEHKYIYNMKPVKWPGGFVSYGIKSGINMRPTGYKLSTPKIQDMIEKFVNGDIQLGDDYFRRKRGYFK